MLGKKTILNISKYIKVIKYAGYVTWLFKGWDFQGLKIPYKNVKIKFILNNDMTFLKLYVQ